MADILLDCDIERHLRTLDMRARLGGDCWTWAYLTKLWMWAMSVDNRDGRLPSDAVVVSELAGWRGDPLLFLAALRDSGWAEVCADGVEVLHAFEKRNRRFFAERDRKRAAAKRGGAEVARKARGSGAEVARENTAIGLVRFGSVCSGSVCSGSVQDAQGGVREESSKLVVAFEDELRKHGLVLRSESLAGGDADDSPLTDAKRETLRQAERDGSTSEDARAAVAHFAAELPERGPHKTRVKRIVGLAISRIAGGELAAKDRNARADGKPGGEPRRAPGPVDIVKMWNDKYPPTPEELAELARSGGNP